MRQFIQRLFGTDARSRLARIHRAAGAAVRVPADWQSCSVYQHKDSLTIVCGSRCRSGVIREGEPVRTLPRTASAAEIGGAVLDIMSHSRTGLPDRSNGGSEPTPWFKDAGFRSWRAFASGARCIGISRSNGEIRIHATDGEAGGGFIQRPADQDRVCEPTPEAVGSVVIQTLDGSTPVPTRTGAP